MVDLKNGSAWTLFVVILLSLGALAVALFAQPFKVCVPVDAAEIDRYQKTISALDGIVDLSVKIGTALVGLGAALLIGLKSGVSLTPFSRILVLVSAVCFTQSALYAVWWRMGVAEIWLNECLGLISEPRLTIRYSMHFYSFMLGLLLLGAIVVEATLQSRERA
jgi:hypothetical protein